MKRHYYVSDDLDDLESVEIELERSGVQMEQIHVLSNNDAHLQYRRLNPVDSISKKDVVRSGLIGLMIGLVGCITILYLFYQFGMNEAVTWAPALFLSLAFLGFCVWEGGLWGIQKPNHDFERFDEDLKHGRHIFFVDVKENQEPTLNSIVEKHPRLHVAGSGGGSPQWVIGAQRYFHRFMQWAP